MVSHHSIIATILQLAPFEVPSRKRRGVDVQYICGLLPLGNLAGLVMIALSYTYRGDGIVVMPKFEMPLFLKTLQDYKIRELLGVSEDWLILLEGGRPLTSGEVTGPAGPYSHGSKQGPLQAVRP